MTLTILYHCQVAYLTVSLHRGTPSMTSCYLTVCHGIRGRRLVDMHVRAQDRAAAAAAAAPAGDTRHISEERHGRHCKHTNSTSTRHVYGVVPSR
jgi:hypothetical protein